MKYDIEEIFSNLIRNLPIDDNEYERRVFRLKKIL